MDNDILDVAIIGGGLAGLTAARLAQRAGATVAVLEAHQLGGRGRTDVRDGFHFNLGAHALYLDGPAHRTMTDLGIDVSGGPPNADGSIGTLEDRHGVLPQTARQLLMTSLLGLRGKAAVGRVLKSLPKVDAAAFATSSVDEWMETLNLPDDAAALLLLLIRVSTYTNAPDVVSADVAITQLQAALSTGVRYLDGGWCRMVDQLAGGLDVRTFEAASVNDDGDSVTIASITGDVVRARAVVVAVSSPDVAARLLGRAPFVVGPKIEAACLDLGIRRQIAPGLWFGVDQPLYLSQHTPPADLAPAGQAVVHVLRYLVPSTHARADHASPEVQRAELRQHASRAGITDDDIVTSRYLHRMTVVSAAPAAHLGGLPGRPTVTATGSDRAFLAGDWVGPTGHLLDASCASATDAARLAVAAAQRRTAVT